MDPIQRGKYLRAIKLHIAAEFTDSKWRELALVVEGGEIIEADPRLLRSLAFGDDDYEGRVIKVIQQLDQKNDSNLQRMIDFTNLPIWLKEHQPKEFAELYSHPLLDSTAVTAIENSIELDQHITRIRQSINSDPELAIGSMKELLESILKSIIEANGETTTQEDLPKLLKRVQKMLRLDPNDVDPNAKGAEIVKRTLSSLGQVVSGIDELRNMYGTGHGRPKKTGVSPRHARLVVNAGSALAIFLMETFENNRTLSQ